MSAPVLALLLPDYFYFVLAICVLVSVCIVLFYAKRHPNPHFRPRKSDIGVLSIVLAFLSGGAAYITAGALDSNFDKEKLEKKAEGARRMAQMKGIGVEEELGLTAGEGGTGAKPEGGTGTTKGVGPDFPEDAPQELRDFFQN